MIVQLRSVSKSYFSEDVETRALRDISLDIAEGEFVAIEGPSGCGKSTLLSVLGLLDSPTSGTYMLNNTNVGDIEAHERAVVRNRELGFIFQNFNLIGDLSIQDNVELPLVYRGVSKSERRARVQDVLRRVNVGHRAKHFPAQLSGGEQQRVAVARALAGNPALLLADEPTGNLDSKNGDAVMSLLAELHSGGSTIVMVTHDRRFATYSNRRVELKDGALAQAQSVLADA
ncbi:MAG: ABC transporter ATP-binding protein [Candidatus Eremiobacteraeota bacterium]|nr:ABC transporter ATP-binding protein [Candidatus Eremiobacteraeota bacterium]